MPTSLLYSGIDAALKDVFATLGTDSTFHWNGQIYGCVFNAEQDILVTSKSLFAHSGFPQQGDVIYLAGKRRQVERIANADLEFVAGGLAGDRMFVDDPNNPSLGIVFNSFIGK